MNYTTPTYQLTNRSIARLYVKEVKKISLVLWPIENAFLTMIFETDIEYQELYTFHLEHFVKAAKMLQKHLKYSVINENYFEVNYKSVV